MGPAPGGASSLEQMLIPDHEIRRLCKLKEMVSPYIEVHLNPASLDVTLGERIMIEVPGTLDMEIKGIHDYSQEDPCWIKPGEFFLAETREIFNLPNHIGAQFVLKSSRAREGWDHAEAGWCDPGWFGSRLTMELKNSRRFSDLPIWPGMRIGQMKFILVSGTPDSTYAQTGRYNCDLGVTASKG
jgi:dCTP deaminase